ncbi:MAG: nitronate monooxygenase [bacterium]|nr:nitronate monooxygenase [bacterium]
MSPAERLRSQTTIPVVVAPMFLVSGVELVTATCINGVIGTFPTLNGRTSDDFEAMLRDTTDTLDRHRHDHPDAVVAPYGVNLIMHRTNPRVAADLELCVKYQAPLVITSLGKPTDVAEAVHGYGGIVISDVASIDHARKAAACGVDGLILVCAGAGGHAGHLNPFAFTAAVREFFHGIVLLAGCISDGRAIRACEALGADFAYLGTRFIPTVESAAPDAYKAMVCESGAADIVHTPVVSGVPASFLRASLEQAGFDATAIEEGKGKPPDLHASEDEMKAWRDVWSAGQGVQTIHETVPVAELVAQLRAEYGMA